MDFVKKKRERERDNLHFKYIKIIEIQGEKLDMGLHTYTYKYIP